MKNSYNKERIDFEKYVNTETGEPLSSEMTGATSINVKNRDKVIMSSKTYFVIDAEAMEYIRQEFNRTEMARILEMCNMVRGEYNIIFDNSTNEPHTKETLMVELDYTVNKFRDFIKKLYTKSVIYYMSGYKDGIEKTWIMLNPFIARKQKTYSMKCVDKFQKLTPRL